jgi:hypothetical protein
MMRYSRKTAFYKKVNLCYKWYVNVRSTEANFIQEVLYEGHSF